MAIAKMKFVNIRGDSEVLDEVMIRCMQTENFQPELAKKYLSPEENIVQMELRNPYTALYSQISEIARKTKIKLHKKSLLHSFGKKKKRKFAHDFPHLTEPLSEHEMSLLQLSNLQRFGIKLEDVYQSANIKVRFGRIPTEQVSKIDDHHDKVFIYLPFDTEDGFEWCAYLTTIDNFAEIDQLFESFSFERINIPSHICPTPGRAKIERGKFRRMIKEFSDAYDKLTSYGNEIKESIVDHEKALTPLDHLQNLDIELEELYACRYLKVRFGRMQTEQAKKLDYFADRMFAFFPFDEENGYHWCMYFTTPDNAPEVDGLFNSLFFERIRIPDYVCGKPGQAKIEIEHQIQNERKLLKENEAQVKKLIRENENMIREIYEEVKFLNDSHDLKKYTALHNAGNQTAFDMVGFIPSDEEESFVEAFSGLRSVEVKVMPCDIDDRFKPPTKLKNNWFVRPFEMFVEMYGLPSYDDIDPTPIVAITYCLLFGIMFGDLGQGLLLSIIGAVLLRWKKMKLGAIMTRIGLSSAIFGTAYGSVFGFEHLLNPMFHWMGFAEKPIELMEGSMTNTILLGAIAIGAALILSSMLVNIIMGIKQRSLERAVLTQNSLMGFLVYATTITGIALLMLAEINIFSLPVIIFLIAIPLLVIFLKEPIASMTQRLKLHQSLGETLTEGLFEMFEVLLGFITNTMSFLRVGGFVLSHAGMMMVVFSISTMMSGSGSVITIIVGNLFVMMLEGLVVGIQVLRLEFYEMFSRYFDGSGEPFVPVSQMSDEDIV